MRRKRLRPWKISSQAQTKIAPKASVSNNLWAVPCLNIFSKTVATIQVQSAPFGHSQTTPLPLLAENRFTITAL